MIKLFIFIVLISLSSFSFQAQSVEPKDNKGEIFNVIIYKYMKVTLGEYNKTLTKEKIKDLNYESALAYSEYQKNWFELNKDKEVKTRNITFDEFIIIHKGVFEKLKIPYDACFFVDIYDSLNERDRKKIWNEMISNPQKKSEMRIFIELWTKMKTGSENPSVEMNEKRKRWLARMRKIELIIEMEKILKKGDEVFYYKK